MQVDQNDDADRRGSQGSDPGGSSSTSQPLTGSKLRNKLQGFAKWRIDSSSIEFPEDGRKFRGGFATVSRAILVSASGSESRADDSAHTGGEKKSDGGTLGQKAVAVKKLKMDNGEDKERVLGLALREAGFLTELSHTNVIKLEGFVEDLSEDKVWLVFPWAANGNLKDFVASANWEIPERIWLIDDVARGVEYLHNRNPPIFHGDLKSANVLVNANCRAVITDFGSARRLTKKDPLVQPEKSRKGAQPVLLLEAELCEATNTVTLKGNQFTLRWAAPELLMEDEPGMEPGLWSDIWALGWIFYEVITNSIPFQNFQNDSAIVIRVIQGNLPSVADHASMVLIRELYSLMITCWIIDPSKRPTAEDCRKSMSRMPMVVPDQQRTKASGSRAHPPKLLMRLGDMHRHQNDYINASKFYNEALGICTDTADNAGRADALLGLARIHKLQGKWSEAVPFYSEAAQIYTDIGNSQGRAGTLRGLADAHRAQGEYSKAITFYSEAVQICTNIGDTQGRANALWGLADIHRVQDKYGEAAMFYSEAFQIYTDMGSRRGRADALWGLAMVHRVQEEYSQAVQLLSESLQIRIDSGDRYGTAWALKDLASIHHDQNQYDDAIRLYEQAAGVFEEIGDTQHTADSLNGAAEARRKLELAEAE